MISNHDMITIARASPITALSLVHKSNTTVNNHDVLTPEIETDHTKGSHRFVNSIYSSVPSILTSVMLSCGDGFGSANDVMSSDGELSTCGSFLILESAVCGTSCSTAHCQILVCIGSMINISPVLSDDHDHAMLPDELDTMSVVLHDSTSGDIVVSD
jgi:hypothetical protein